MRTDGTVTAAEIGRIAGVGRAAVSNWRRRHDDFPKPVGGTTTSPHFALAEVEEWLRSQGKLQEVSDDERLWHRIKASGADVDLAEIVGKLGLALLWLHRTPHARRRFEGADDHHLAIEIPQAVRAAAHDTPGGEVGRATLTVEQVRLIREVLDLSNDFDAVETFNVLLARFLETYSRRIFTTPQPIADLMAALADPVGQVILDPACGSGSLLVAAGQRASRLLGQEYDENLARLAAIRLAMGGTASRVQAGDSLRSDAFEGLQVDVVLCNPPFGQADWGRDELAYDPRWQYGVAPKAESELAWVQHALSHAKPGGMVVILMPPAAASRRSGRRIRAELLRRGTLRAVATLPAGQLPGTALAIDLWILRHPIPAVEPRVDVLMIDTTGHTGGRAADLIERAWRSFDQRRGELPRGAVSVRAIDLLDDQIDLTPARQLAAGADPAEEKYAETMDNLLETLALVSKVTPRVSTQPGERQSPTISLGDLARAGALTILPTAQTAIEPNDVVVPAAGPAATYVVDEVDVRSGPYLSLLRPDPQVLDSEFLAGFIRDPRNQRYAGGTRSGSRRLDVRSIQVPWLPLAEQRRYADVLHRSYVLQKVLDRAAELNREVTGHLTTGLAGGTLRPLD